MTTGRSKRQRLDHIVRTALADQQEQSGINVDDLGRFAREFLRPHRRAIVLTFFALLTWASIAYFFAMTNRYLIDRVLAPEMRTPSLSMDRRHVLIVGVLFVAGINMILHTIGMACHWVTSFLTLRIGQTMAISFRERIAQKLDALHLGYYDRTQTGRIIARIQSDVGRIQNTIQGHLSQMLVEPFKLTVGFGVLFFMNWRMATVLAVAAPVYAGVFIWLRPRIKRNGTAQSRLSSRLYGLTAERLSAVQVVQVFGRERSELGAFSRQVHNGVRLAQRHALYNQGLGFAAASVSTLATGGILYFGLSAVRKELHGMTLGEVVAFVQLSQQVFQPIQSLTGMAAVMQVAMVSLRRVFALLDEPGVAGSGRIRLSGMAGKIRFDNVTFTYPTQTHPALQDVSLDIQPAEHVAIMGPSGSGKTTIFNLLLRFYEPEKGGIHVGGVHLSDVDASSLRRHVRYVQQEPFLFSGTLMENLRYGAPQSSIAEIVEVAKQVEMHDFISKLPEKYETEVAEQGTGLSGGQKQRLALATALLTKPEILLLDDTTSALDSQTEARIRETLSKVLEGRTSLTITQRIATARNCVRIIVLEDGRITQSGTHEELSLQEGFYRNICKQQDAL